MYNSVTSEDPDTEHIERLLKGWCRTRVSVDGHEVIIKSAAHPSVAHLIEKYEKTNEFAIAMLAGKLHLMNNGNDTLLRGWGAGVGGGLIIYEVVHMCRPEFENGELRERSLIEHGEGGGAFRAAPD